MGRDTPSDAEKTLAKRVLTQFESEMKSGRRISSPLSIEALVPFELAPNTSLKNNFKTILLVNEMCASMCDIFSAILQDNNMAEVVGSKTMGAGGNVVSHYQAPNSHMILRQTESLIIRSNDIRSYIENNGVEPDYPMDVASVANRKYRPVRATALNLLTTSHKRKR